MKSAYITPTFDTEAALCQAFLRGVPADWLPYPETAGWDILLVHRVGCWQIGIEAKLTLNAKVLVQAIDGRRREVGPDFRAVLVGKVVAENAELARALGLTVITPKAERAETDWGSFGRFNKQGPRIPQFYPDLPKAEALERIGAWWGDWDREPWFDCFPTHRHKLPDYVPEVACGVPSPMILSDWKIKAMRVCVWVEKHGVITRAIFKKLGIDPSRWMNGYWLQAGEARGDWVPGSHFPGPGMRKEHPNIYALIEADYPEWSQKVTSNG